MIEVDPKPECVEALSEIGRRNPKRVEVHSVALCDPEGAGGLLAMVTDKTKTSTGAHISPSSDGETVVSVPCTTLDHVTDAARAHGGRWFVKSDLQGYELFALRGASRTLQQTDVILTEVSFYAQTYETPIAEMIAFLAAAGFELHDIASIYARPRDDRPRQGDFIFVRRDSTLAAECRWS